MNARQTEPPRSADREGTLFVTVGGSPQPIQRALGDRTWARVVFIATPDDPDRDQQGSRKQVDGPGYVIASRPNAEPDLPNFMVQFDLPSASVDVIEVPPDDLDTAVAALRTPLAEAAAAGPSPVVADYTGGTKSMSAALALCALDLRGVELQLVSGPRDNLHKVHSGEAVRHAPTRGVRTRRMVELAVNAWSRYAYGEAHELLAQIKTDLRDQLGKNDPSVRALTPLVDASKALHAWDQHRYRDARHTFSQRFMAVPAFEPLHPAIAELADEATRAPRVLGDLLRSAERRAARGRYDDAVARAYRMVEWAAQWLVSHDLGVATDAVPANLVRDDVAGGEVCADGTYRGGLVFAWSLVWTHIPKAETVGFLSREHGRVTGWTWMTNLLQLRNQSFYAHGQRPIDAQDWAKFAAFLNPMMDAIAADAAARGAEARLPQLPTAPPQPWLDALVEA